MLLTQDVSTSYHKDPGRHLGPGCTRRRLAARKAGGSPQENSNLHNKPTIFSGKWLVDLFSPFSERQTLNLTHKVASFIYIKPPFLCLCMWVYTHVCAHVHVCRGPKVTLPLCSGLVCLLACLPWDKLCLSQNLAMAILARLGWPVSLPVSHLQHCGYRHVSPCQTFVWVLKIQIQELTLVQWGISWYNELHHIAVYISTYIHMCVYIYTYIYVYSLSHLPYPMHLFWNRKISCFKIFALRFISSH